MLILVPAPMTKSPNGTGDPVDLAALSFPGLTPERTAVLEALGRPLLRVAPTTPAIDLYRGVLMDAALDGLDAEARARAQDQLLYVSAVWGPVRPTDWLPDYRAHMCERPEGPGHLVQYWQRPLESVLPGAAGDGLVVDFRSSEYLLAWRPGGELAQRWVVLKPVRDTSFDRGSGGSTARIVRGLALRRILSDGIEANEPEELATALEAHFRVQLRPPADSLHPWELRIAEPR